MIFKRRDPRTLWRTAVESIYPKGGWWRAATYVGHRMRRLPDQPHRIARGVAAGTFISFTPLFGLHFVGAAVIAWLIRGNIVAALLGTFVGNPVTMPFIAVMSVALGRWMLGVEGTLSPHMISGDFTRAVSDLWHNLGAMFNHQPTHWHGLAAFWREIFLPYLVGGILPGLIAAVAFHYLTLPLFHAYQNRRAKKAHERADKRRAARQQQAERLAQAMAARQAQVAQSQDAPPVEPPRDPG